MEIGEPRHPESVQSYHDEIDDHILAILFVVIFFRVATLVSQKSPVFFVIFHFLLSLIFFVACFVETKEKNPKKQTTLIVGHKNKVSILR
jgi:uncharacterized membrane protein